MFLSFYSTTMLALEPCNVINLRLTKLMAGTSDSRDEAHLMVSEKVHAMFEAGASLMAGAPQAAWLIDTASMSPQMRNDCRASTPRFLARGRGTSTGGGFHACKA